jgi:hypothetical protein
MDKPNNRPITYLVFKAPSPTPLDFTPPVILEIRTQVLTLEIQLIFKIKNKAYWDETGVSPT